MDRQEVNVISSANTLVELVLQRVLSLLISDSIQKSFMFIYMVTEVDSFNSCEVRLNGTKVCEDTIMEEELVLLNVNPINSSGNL